MFVNFTNHPSANWSGKQAEAARVWGEIRDISFPAVDPGAPEWEICRIGRQYCQEILACQPRAVLCQGEFTLAYFVIRYLRRKGITVVAACSERKVVESGQIRQSVFEFTRFREYREEQEDE